MPVSAVDISVGDLSTLFASALVFERVSKSCFESEGFSRLGLLVRRQ